MPNLPLKVDEQTGVPTVLTVIVAKRDHGKTTLAMALLEGYQVPRKNTVLIDPQGTFAARSGIPRYDISPDPESVDKFLERILEKAKQEGHGPFLVIDEADRFMTSRSVTGGQSGRLFELVNVSRGWGMGALMIAHGSNVISKNVLEQADEVYIGNTVAPGALKYWGDFMGHPNFEELVRRLPPHYFICWANSAAPNQFRGVITVRNGTIEPVSESELRDIMGEKAYVEEDEEVSDEPSGPPATSEPEQPTAPGPG